MIRREHHPDAVAFSVVFSCHNIKWQLTGSKWYFSFTLNCFAMNTMEAHAVR
jgi:hypothetical protein